MAEARTLVLNDVLCFLLCKYGSVPVKLLKSALLDFYNADLISEAKVCLLDNITDLQLAVRLPHVSRRRDGDDRITREFDDIFLLVSHLDEQKALELLPKFVCSGPDNVPSLRIYEGDLKVMLNMICKLGDKVAAMGSTLAAMVNDVRELQAKVSAPEPFPTLQQTQAQAVIKSASGQCRQQSLSNQCAGGNNQDHQTSVHNPERVVIPASSNDSSRSYGLDWANAVSTPHTSSNRFAVLASTTDDDDDVNDNSFEQVRPRKPKRQRHGTIEQQQQQRQPPQQRQQFVVGESGRIYDGVDRRRRRGPLVFGKSSTRSVISAARELKQKAVFYIGNVSVDCSAEKLNAFVTGMNVEVFSCFPVEPRKRRGGDLFEQRAFRLCINVDHSDRMLNAALWPVSVTVSAWHYKPPNVRSREGDRGVLLEYRLQQPTVAQTASSVLSAAGSESTVVADEATGDDTVIIMEYNEANDDTPGPSKHDDGDQQ